MSKVKTKLFKSVFKPNEAFEIFLYLKNNIEWEQGIYSNKEKKISRLGSTLYDMDPYIEWVVKEGLIRMNLKGYLVGIPYLNYYRDGKDFCPQHSHDSIQIVFVFNEEGGERELKIGTKNYSAYNGDVVLFGKSSHGFKMEENKKGRISLALFVKEIKDKSCNLFQTDLL